MDSYLKFPAHWCIAESCKFVEMWTMWNVLFKFLRTLFFEFLGLIFSQNCLLGTSNRVDRNKSQGRLCRQKLLICKTLIQFTTEAAHHRQTCNDKLWPRLEPEPSIETIGAGAGPGGSQCWVSGFRLARAGGNGRRWWWQWQYSAHLPLPVSHNVSAHDSGA